MHDIENQNAYPTDPLTGRNLPTWSAHTLKKISNQSFNNKLKEAKKNRFQLTKRQDKKYPSAENKQANFAKTYTYKFGMNGLQKENPKVVMSQMRN